jgi:hypothetical protein
VEFAAVLDSALRMPDALQQLRPSAWLYKGLTYRELADRNLEVGLISRTDCSSIPAVSQQAALTEHVPTGQRQRDADLIVLSDTDPTLKHRRVYHLIFLPGRVFGPLRGQPPSAKP